MLSFGLRVHEHMYNSSSPTAHTQTRNTEINKSGPMAVFILPAPGKWQQEHAELRLILHYKAS